MRGGALANPIGGGWCPPRLDLLGEVESRFSEVELRFGEVDLEIGEVRPQLEVRSGCRSPCVSLGREQRRGLAQPQRFTW